MRDVIVIGGGPAGLSAASYARRAAMDVLVLERDSFGGGQIVTAHKIDNYLGLPGIEGYEIIMKFREHASLLEVEFMDGEVAEIIREENGMKLLLKDGQCLYSKNVIIATGAVHKKLGVLGEDRLTGRGISYCATCDGAFYRGKKVAVIGGGEVALSDALFLSGLCSQVYLVHRREGLRASKALQKKVFERDNIQFLPGYVVDEILGKNQVEGVCLRKLANDEKKELSVDGLFVAIGMEPVTGFVPREVEKENAGYLITDESCRTSVKGIFAVGDVRSKKIRQLVTAVADGAICIGAMEEDQT